MKAPHMPTTEDPGLSVARRDARDAKTQRDGERPVRIQLRRTKGWKMPPNTEKVDRSTGWGNPWIAGDPGRVKLHNGDVVRIGPAITTDGAVHRFRLWMQGEMGIYIGQYVRHRLFDAVLCPGAPPTASFLRGKNLACWCKPGEPCHADVLLELANGPLPEQPRDQQVEGDGSRETSLLNTSETMSEDRVEAAQ